jgi:hypothetical protein
MSFEKNGSNFHYFKLVEINVIYMGCLKIHKFAFKVHTHINNDQFFNYLWWMYIILKNPTQILWEVYLWKKID